MEKSPIVTFKQKYMKKSILITSVFLFLLCHVFSRAWFFIDYPFPMMGPDTISYYIPIWQIRNGEWPDFSIRTPGYPIFLGVLLHITQNILSVVYVQSFLTAIACVTVIYSFWNIKPIYSLLISLSLSFWTVKSSGAVFYDLIIYSESLYSSLVLFCIAFIVFAVVKNKIIFLFVASLFASTCIFVRPSGIILLPAFLIFIFRFISAKQKKIIPWAYVPLIFAPIVLSSYNLFLHNKFTPSIIGALATQIPSLYTMEPNNNYPDEINERLLKITKDRDRWLTQGIREFLMNSDPQTFSDIVSDSVGSLLYGSLIPHFSSGSVDEYMANYQDLNLAALKQRVETYKKFDKCFFAIRQDLLVKHWRFNIRWFTMMIRAYYSSASNADELVLAYMQSVTIKNYYIQPDNILNKTKDVEWREQNKILNDFYQRYITIPTITLLTNTNDANRLQHRYDLAGRLWGDGAKYEMNESGVHYWITKTPLISIFLSIQKVYRLVFSRDIWLFSYFFVFLLTVFRLIRTRFQHDGALILLFLMLVLFFNALVTSQAYFLPRYAYPFEWISSAILFFSPFIFVDNKVGGTSFNQI